MRCERILSGGAWSGESWPIITGETRDNGTGGVAFAHHVLNTLSRRSIPAHVFGMVVEGLSLLHRGWNCAGNEFHMPRTCHLVELARQAIEQSNFGLGTAGTDGSIGACYPKGSRCIGASAAGWSATNATTGTGTGTGTDISTSTNTNIDVGAWDFPDVLFRAVVAHLGGAVDSVGWQTVCRDFVPREFVTELPSESSAHVSLVPPSLSRCIGLCCHSSLCLGVSSEIADCQPRHLTP
jgi:hypothetical protein